MPGAARLNDTCTGHGCWPSRANNQASDNVLINSRGIHRVGDSWNAHTCPAIPETHASTQTSGSTSVFVNGRPLARIGDSIACGSSVATGSNNVIADNLFTITTPPPLSAKTKQKHANFIADRGIGSKCDLTQIPSVMLVYGWNKGAEFLAHWFNSSGTNKYVSWSWLETYQPVQTAIHELLNANYLFSDNAKKQLIKRLRQNHLLTNRREQINPLGDIESLHDNWHFQYINQVNSDYIFSDLTAALGEFSIYAIPYGGYVEPALPLGYHVHIEAVSVYAKDGFDFKDSILNPISQPLGSWNLTQKKVLKTPKNGYCNLSNSDFRKWQSVYNKGRDYHTYSDIKTINTNYDFIF